VNKYLGVIIMSSSCSSRIHLENKKKLASINTKICKHHKRKRLTVAPDISAEREVDEGSVAGVALKPEQALASVL